MRDDQDAGYRWMVARSHMKCTGAARAPLWCGELLPQKIEAQLGAIKRMPPVDTVILQGAKCLGDISSESDPGTPTPFC